MRIRERATGSGADHYVMRELNRSLVLEVVKQRSPISRAAIAKVTDLAKPTVSAIVDDLITGDLVNEVGYGVTPSGGGRPPILLEFNARSQYVAAVHIGVHTTTTVVADARGVELGRTERRTAAKRPARAIERIADDIRATLDRIGGTLDRLAAVGVCVPGLIDRDSGVCLLAPNLGWRNVDVAGRLDGLGGAVVYVHNTSQATAVAEAIEGVAKDTTEVVMLYAGSGIGAGVMSDGKLFHGDRGIAGEIGHCPVPFSDRVCACGKVGCLETVATAQAIVQNVCEALDAGRPSTLSGVDRSAMDAVHVAAAAEAGDELAREVLGVAGQALGFAASWLVNVLNPHQIVLGGGLIAAGDALLGPCRETLEHYALPQAFERLRVDIASLGQDVEVRGAVLLALQRAETYYRVIFQA
ncbi:MAG TPA: ROK family protein [Ilumatobacter sp.]|nr:ROK family protein [Ilumatobacter sp.]